MGKEEESTAHEEETLEENVEEKEEEDKTLEEEEDLNAAGKTPGEVKEEIGELLELIKKGEESPKSEEEESSEEEEESSEEEEESEEEEPPKEKEEESDKDLINRLRGEINTLSGKLMSPAAPLLPPVIKEGEEKEEEEEQVSAVVSTDITQKEYDEAMTDKDKFSDLIDKVVAIRTKQELSNVTQSVDGVIAEKLSLNQRVNDFFDEHENLRGQRDFIGYLAEIISDEHKDWNMDKIFKELPKVAYDRLGLSADSTTTNRNNGNRSKKRKKTKSKSQKPAFTTGSKSRASADNLTPQQKDIKDTLEL